MGGGRAASPNPSKAVPTDAAAAAAAAGYSGECPMGGDAGLQVCQLGQHCQSSHVISHPRVVEAPEHGAGGGKVGVEANG